jgi:hypothetical protein
VPAVREGLTITAPGAPTTGGGGRSARLRRRKCGRWTRFAPVVHATIAFVTRVGSNEAPSGEVVAEAARMLRVVVEAMPPRTTTDRATVRRIEGAALALEALAGAPD